MFTTYQPRPLTFLGVEPVAWHRLKVYAIRFGDDPFDRSRFDAAWKLAATALPADETPGRPGVGFVVLHQGRTGDYIILCWWDRENELPTRIFIRDGADWRPAVGGESFCVWDLRVLWWEREVYVGTVLTDRPDGLNAYLATTTTGYA